MKSNRVGPFILGVALTFATFALQNAVAQQATATPLPKGIQVSADHGGIYDDGSYVYIVQPKSGETLMISKTTTHRLSGGRGDEIPKAWKFSGNHCELVTSKSWK